MNRLVAALTLLALVGCSQGDRPLATADSAPRGYVPAEPAFGLVSAGTAAGTAYEARLRQQRAFADLPDRGELLSYDRGGNRGALVEGAYTWHGVDVSEEHALRAIATGSLRLRTPSGQTLDIRYDHHVEHPSGDLSWIGHIEGQPGAQTILTFGADAVYGSIGQPGKRSLRLTTRNGAGWIVETDPTKLAGIASAGAHPRKPDALAVPKAHANFADAALMQQKATPQAAMAAAAATTIDVLVGYTQGFASAQGGASGALTRLNYLVTVGNEALANSQVNARIRLVHAMQVNYADNSPNESTLEQLTGYDSSSEQPTTPNAAFNALRAARETYGADLVTLVRQFRDPEQDGCGIAWLIGGGRTGVAGQDYFGYSVVSDGTDTNEEDDQTYYCRDETLIHELAHNMGSQHDRESAEGDDGSLDDDDYGAFSYSFGLKTAATAGNFYTVMAYGDEGQTDFRVFSNPRITFCGGRACGTTTFEDNARSLTNLAPSISAFRSTRVGGGGYPILAGDFNGDNRADILWRNLATGANAIWRSASSATQQAVAPLSDQAWLVAGNGDFNGDGRSDILWRYAKSGRNVIWWSANSATRQDISAVTNTSWAVAGNGDFNGDGRADILWRNGASGANVIWLSANSSTQRPVATVADVSWDVAGVGDYNGDGRADILWRNGRTGANSIWRSGDVSAQQTVSSVSDVRWIVAGSGDFNGDGRADILWRHTASGMNAIWFSASASTQRGLLTVADQSWKIASVGDFSGDGRADILWRHATSGANAIWRSGDASTQQAVATVKDASWSVAG